MITNSENEREKNIALGMVNIEYSKINIELEVQINDEKFKCIVVEKPFFDPKKKITSTSL